MAANDDSSGKFNSTSSDSSDLNNSIVQKVASLIPSSITKWFGKSKAVQRRRDSDSDDDSYTESEQPPLKRVRHLTDYTDSYSYQNGSPPKLTPRPSINTDILSNIRARPPVRTTLNFNRLLTEKSSIDNCPNETRRSYSSLYDDPTPSTSGAPSSNFRYNFSSPSPIREIRDTSTTLLSNEKRIDSGESTSGCSSMAQKNPIVPAGDEEVVQSSINDKPESDRSIATNSSKRLKTDSLKAFSLSRFGDSLLGDRPNVKNASLASRRPSFNTSSFSSTRLNDRSLSIERIATSPFYMGLTMFGGASAYRKPPQHSVNRSPSHGIGLVRSVQIKPSNEATMNKSSSTSLSQTARRILDTLEQFNSPLSEAKKIPRINIQSKNDTNTTLSLSVSPYTRTPRPNRVGIEALSVPTVPEILQMKKREQMQSSTEKMRNTAAQSKSTLNEEVDYRSNLETPVAKSKHSNKIKTKINKVRPSKNDFNDDTVEEVNLPNVVLPITTLPKFDLLPIKSTASVTSSSNISPLISKPVTITTSPSTQTSVSEKPIAISKPSTSNTNKHKFNFAAPIELSKSTKSLMSINNFKFSKPVIVNGSDENLTFKSPSHDAVSPLKRKTPKTNGDIDVIIKPAPLPMKTSGSVMDVLTTKSNDDFMAKFKPAADTWECGSCLIRNKMDQEKCIACGTAKTPPATLSLSTKSPPSVPSSSSALSFGNQFKMPTDKWECSVCMVRNNLADERCVACTSAKPGSSGSSTSTTIKSSSTLPPISTGFGDKFKPPSGSWTCAVCMIQNKGDVLKCAACETPKPGAPSETKPNTTSGFGGTFTKKPSEWECPSCMVRNPTNRLMCVCCDAPQPRSNAPQPAAPAKGIVLEPTTQFKFGIDKANTPATTSSTATTVSSGFVFGSTSETKSTSATSSGFTFGTQPSSGTTGFTFGTPSKTENTSPAVKRKLNDETDSADKGKSDTEKLPTSSPPKFVFDANKSVSSSTTASTMSGFTFSALSKPVPTSSTAPSSGLFSFGTPKSVSSSQPTETSFGVTPSTQSTALSNNANTIVESPKPEIKSTPETKPMFSMPTTSSNPFGSSSATPSALFGNDASKSNTISSPFANKDVNVTTTTTSSAFSSNITFGSPKTTLSAVTTPSFGVATTTSSNKFGLPPAAPKPDLSAPIFGPTTRSTIGTKDFVFETWSSTPVLSGPATSANLLTTNMFGNNSTSTQQFNVGPSGISTFGPTASQSAFGIAPTTTSSAVFGNASSITPAFGSTSSAGGPTFGSTNTAPTFGSAAAPEFGKSNAPTGFGNSNDNSSSGIFGNNSAAAPTFFGASNTMAANTFAFGAKPDEKKPVMAFGVDNSGNSVATKPTGFSFNAPPSTANGGFNFKPVGSAPAFGASTTSNAFGAVDNTSTAPTPNLGFGGAAAPSVPTFGAPTMQPAAPPAFMFGQPQQPSNLFTFGSSSSDAKPANTNGPFTFGGAASQSSISVPNFDPNIKPTFHFSDGAPATFTAQTTPGQAGAVPPRRYKKAVRRTSRI